MDIRRSGAVSLPFSPLRTVTASRMLKSSGGVTEKDGHPSPAFGKLTAQLRHSGSIGTLVEVMLHNELAETISYWATTLGILFALFAGVYALWKYRADRKFHKEDRARNAYASFMKLALEHPEFFPGCWETVKTDKALKNKFEWYIAHFLWASEDIMLHDPTDRYGYVDGIKDTIREHAEYFSSKEFEDKERGGYCSSLQILIELTIRDHNSSSSVAAQGVPVAERPAPV